MAPCLADGADASLAPGACWCSLWCCFWPLPPLSDTWAGVAACAGAGCLSIDFCLSALSSVGTAGLAAVVGPAETFEVPKLGMLVPMSVEVEFG